MYSSQVLDHFENPRNAGRVTAPHGTGRAQNPGCGDVMEITVEVADGTIREARFMAQGCVPALACASQVAEWLTGKTVEEARQLRKEQIVEALGGLPAASLHASQLAVDAAKAALAGL